mgnify:CR=1 FL=1
MVTVPEQYRELAPRYDRRFSLYLARVIEKTLERLTLEPGQSVLDIGCGTGELLKAIYAAQPRLQLLAGIDLSPDMLARAREKLSAIPAVELHVDSAERIPYPDKHFHAVTMTGMIHYLPHPLRALTEVRRVLAPGGMVVAIDMAADFFLMRAGFFLRRFLNPAAQHLYSLDEITRIFAAAGFTVSHGELFKAGVFGLYTLKAR